MDYVAESSFGDDFDDLDFVTKIAAFLYAKRYDDSVPFEDYKHYGILGYLEAKQKFDPEKGASFKSFAAYRIKGAILNGISKYTEKLDLHFYKKRRDYKKIEFSDSDDVEERFQQFSSSIIELTFDMMLGDFFDGFLSQGDVCQKVLLDTEHGQKILLALQELSETEKNIVIYHYYYDFSFKMIAEYMGLSKGRVSQLHKISLEKMLSFFSDGEDFLFYL